MTENCRQHVTSHTTNMSSWPHSWHVNWGQWDPASAHVHICDRNLQFWSPSPSLLYPSRLSQRKTTTQQLISCFNTTSVSLLFQSDKILMTFTPSLLPFHLPPSAPSLHPAKSPLVLLCGFPLSFFCSLCFSLIEIARFEMEKLFTLTAKALGWWPYPEPLVMLLKTMQQ